MYRGPIEDPRVTGSRFRLKEWHYISFASDRYFLAVAVVQLGYVASGFCYLVDRETGTRFEWEALSPMGRALSFAQGPTRGASRFKASGAHVELARSRASLSLTLRGAGRDVVVEGDLAIRQSASLSLLCALPSGGRAYTNKAAALPATARLTIDGEAVDLNGMAAIDWTRSLAERETKWKWASFSGLADGVAIGLNLSAEVYDDASGASRENVFFRDGDLYILGAARFGVPARPKSEPWTIIGDDLDLTFTPIGARAQKKNFGLVVSDFVQPYGTFRGVVRGVEITDAFGVVESHRSVW